jgi:predicted permease
VTGRPQPPAWIAAAYRALAQSAPRRVRPRFSAEAADLFDAIWVEERPGSRIGAAWWLAALFVRLLRSIAGLYLDELRRRQARRRAGERRATVLGGVRADVLVAWRQFRSRPVAAAASLVTLSLALGVNTSLYGAAHAVLFRSTGIADADRVVFIWTLSQAGARDNLTPGRAIDLAERVGAFDAVAFVGHVTMIVTGRGPASRWPGASVTSSFFDVLRARPRLGRTFHASGARGDEVVLSDQLWRTEFGGDPAVVGTSLVMNGRPRQIVGVMGAEFYWPSITAEPGPVNAPQFWSAVGDGDVPERPGSPPANPRLDRGTGYLRAVARLRDGVELQDAEAELATAAARLALEHPGTDGGRTAVLVPLREQFFGAVRRPLLLLVAATALVVLLACLNAANLMLVGLAHQARELAVRAALGASAWRLARQVLVDGLLLSIAAGVLGIGAAAASQATLSRLAPITVGRLDTQTVVAPVVVVAVVVAIAAGLLLGVVPAMALAGARRTDRLRVSGTVSAGGARLRHLLVGAEVALTFVLLAGAALFSQSLLKLRAVDVGLRPEQLLTLDVAGLGGDAARAVPIFSSLLEAIRAVPGVRHAAGAVTLPIGGDDFGTRVRVPGRPPPAPGAEPRIGWQVVTPGWFDTLGIRRIAGRDFTPHDDGRAGLVAIVNERFARETWPGESALGRRFQKGRSPDSLFLTVVGVVADVRHAGPGQPARPEIYEPFAQAPMTFLAIAVRTDVDPMAVAPAIRAAAHRLDPGRPISGVSTMQAHLDRAYGDARFLWIISTAFGVVALVVAALGIHGIVSLAAAQRGPELALRLALGATPRSILTLVMGQGARPVAAGLAAGLVIAILLGRIVGRLLFDTSAADPAALTAAAAVLSMAAAMALWLPARRAATRADAGAMLKR